MTPVVAEAIDDARYAPYVDRQEAEVAELRASERVTLGGDLDFAAIPGLSIEMVERLDCRAPGHAGGGGARSRDYAGGADRDPAPRQPARGMTEDEARHWAAARFDSLAIERLERLAAIVIG